MGGYRPLNISGNQTGLVQERQDFLLPDDAYPVLENAYIWREQIRRKRCFETLGRLRRTFTASSIGVSGASPWSFNLFTLMGITETNAQLEAENVTITIGGTDIVDQGDGTMEDAGMTITGTINYITGAITITGAAGGAAATATFGYFPNLPCMGLRSRERTNINNEQLVAFDTTYAYIYSSGFEEFITGTTWTGVDSDFFWSTNYWVDSSNQKVFWVTNFSGTGGDPIRYTNGTAWIDFAPTIDASANKLNQCLALLPFRGRMLAFNTFEGANLGASTQFRQRIRWAAIGNPFDTVSAIVTTVNANAWRDDIRGQGGFLDIPTAQDIVSVGFVRDNLVIYCESSTWQLRYTGNSIQPFQIEKINTELGVESTFSAVQFDTSLNGIGDKGIVECDSFDSRTFDAKIPDLVFTINNDNSGLKRVHGQRDFFNRIAYWIYPLQEDTSASVTYPNRRLVWNYENDSWGVFTDCLTALGEYQPIVSRTWAGSPFPWSAASFPWVDAPAQLPRNVGGNQQGFVLFLDSLNTNDPSLTITGITGNTTTPTTITSPNHNLASGQIIEINNIPATDPFTALNDSYFQIDVVNANSFRLFVYDAISGEFSTPQLDAAGTFLGTGTIRVRDNFRIVSKRFNFYEEGQAIQIGYIDILTPTTASGAFSMYLYQDNDPTPSNISPNNDDSFFNNIVPTTTLQPGLDKVWNRVFCNTRGNSLTIEYTLSNLQMIGIEQESDVQIDAQVIHRRPAGTELQITL